MTIAILIGTYGEDHWRDLALSRALPSALGQGADEILDRHEKEGTISSVRNALAEDAESEWLCFLDADDELAPGYIGAMRRALERTRGEDGTPPLFTPAVSYVRKGRRQPPRFHPGEDLSQNNYLVVGTLVQRDLFLSVGGFSDYPHGFEDFSLWSKCWRIGAQVVQVRRAVYIAYWNDNSIHRSNWRNRRWQVDMHKRVVREMDEWEEGYRAGAPGQVPTRHRR